MNYKELLPKPLRPDNKLCKFGKYQGQTWEEISGKDPAYIYWAVGNVSFLSVEEQNHMYEMIQPYLDDLTLSEIMADVCYYGSGD